VLVPKDETDEPASLRLPEYRGSSPARLAKRDEHDDDEEEARE
jgi:hypothetical protein